MQLVGRLRRSRLDRRGCFMANNGMISDLCCKTTDRCLSYLQFELFELCAGTRVCGGAQTSSRCCCFLLDEKEHKLISRPRREAPASGLDGYITRRYGAGGSWENRGTDEGRMSSHPAPCPPPPLLLLLPLLLHRVVLEFGPGSGTGGGEEHKCHTRA